MADKIKDINKRETIKSTLKLGLFLSSGLLSNNIFPKNRKIRCLIDSGSINQKTINDFELLTGIGVELISETYFSSTSVLNFDKLLPDLIIASNRTLELLKNYNKLYQLDKSKIPNIVNIFSNFINDFNTDPDYMIPYSWGSLGIAFNAVMHKNTNINSWRYLYDSPLYKDQIFLLNNARYTFGLGLKLLGYKVNETSLKKLKQVNKMLERQMAYIRGFHQMRTKVLLNNYPNIIAQAFSNHVSQIVYPQLPETSHIVYQIPKEGTILWQNSIAVFNSSQRIREVYQFINYLLSSEVALDNILQYQYGTSNEAAYNLLPDDFKNNSIIFPDIKILSKSEVLMNMGYEYDNMLNNMFEDLKKLKT